MGLKDIGFLFWVWHRLAGAFAVCFNECTSHSVSWCSHGFADETFGIDSLYLGSTMDASLLSMPMQFNCNMV